MKKILLILTAAAAVACAREPKLVIIHTNDTHSHFEPDRTGEFAGCGGSIERAAFIDSVRLAEGEDKVLLLHAGDFSQGTPYFSELGGNAEIEVMNDIRYDCTALGNHEFDNGLDELYRRLLMLDCPVVCADKDFAGHPLADIVVPSVILERGGMKIGVIGLLTSLKSNVKNETARALVSLDDVEVVARESAALKEAGCDLIVLLTHIGYKQDLELASKISGVDLIIGGHSHTRCDGFKYVRDTEGKRVPVISDGKWGREIGVIKIY